MKMTPVMTRRTVRAMLAWRVVAGWKIDMVVSLRRELRCGIARIGVRHPGVITPISTNKSGLLTHRGEQVDQRPQLLFAQLTETPLMLVDHDVVQHAKQLQTGGGYSR